jgi:(p)ppGpp synthase/HD superfamily hydrolase
VFWSRENVAKSILKNPLSTNFDRALQLAHDLHRRQPRKSTEVPYIAHLLAVTAMVLENGGDEDTAIAALLHDAVEDQGGQPTLDRIRREFGERVAHIVYECTDADGEPKPPWRFRKEQYLEALPHKSTEALLVAFGDKIHNCRSIVRDLRRDGAAVWKRFEGRRDGTLWYYRELLEKFPREPYASLYDEFAAIVHALNEVAESC